MLLCQPWTQWKQDMMKSKVGWNEDWTFDSHGKIFYVYQMFWNPKDFFVEKSFILFTIYINKILGQDQFVISHWVHKSSWNGSKNGNNRIDITISNIKQGLLTWLVLNSFDNDAYNENNIYLWKFILINKLYLHQDEYIKNDMDLNLTIMYI